MTVDGSFQSQGSAAATGEPAVILLSGGIDSSTALAVARSEGYRCYALSVRYGQRNSHELSAARAVALAMGAVEHRVAELDLSWIGGSALTAPIPVPKTEAYPPVGAAPIPVTYVPARNSLFLCLATAWAETVGTAHVFIGVNRIDYSGYPDCRPEFLRSMQRALRLGTRRGDLCVHAPLVDLSKAEIIRRGTALGLDYGMTWSCYDPQPGDRACGHCDSCHHRHKGFIEAGIPDPTRYSAP